MLTKKSLLFVVFLFALIAVLAACGGNGGDTADTVDSSNNAATNTSTDTADTSDSSAMDEPVHLRIFVGLGTGTDPDQISAQEALAEEFNSTHDNIEIEFLIVPNDESVQRMLAMISGGDAPDLVGPGGVDVAATYFDLWEDVGPYIEAENFDTSDYYGAAVDLYNYPEKTVGLPLGMFPSFIFYNTDLFDAAGVDYPTGDYSDSAWTFDALREVAMELTLDANGNNATSADFDANNVVQYGFDDSWIDVRGFMAFFDPPGQGRPVSDDFKMATVNSDEYKYGLNWWNNAIWVDHFMGDLTVQEGRDAAGADPFGIGTTAMFYSHTWFMPEGLVDLPFDYDFAAAPVNQKGTRVARIHADTFYIPENAPHKDASWEVLKWLTSAEHIVDVCLIYGCIPSRHSVQDDYTAGLIDRYGDHNYDVIYEAINYLDNPHHESWTPEVGRVGEVLGAQVWDTVFTEQIGDTDAWLDEVNAEVQAILDEYWANQ